MPRGGMPGSAVGNIAAAASLIHLPKELFEKIWDPSFQPVSFITGGAFALGVSGAATQPFQVSPDGDFVITGGYYTSFVAATPGTFVAPAAYTIQIRVGSKSVIGSAGGAAGAAHIDVVLNRTRGGVMWPAAMYCPSGATVSTTLTNLDATARDVWVVYEGFLVY